jgi:hypothetical protein
VHHPIDGDDDAKVVDVDEVSPKLDEVSPKLNGHRRKFTDGANTIGVLEQIEKLDEQIDKIAIGRTPTRPDNFGAIRVSFADGESIAQFADLISRLARLGKDVEIIIRVVGAD